MKQVKRCINCLSSKTKIIAIPRDRLVSKKTFSIEECKMCQLKWTNPQPSKEELMWYYKSDEYVSHSECRKTLIDICYHLAKKVGIRRKKRVIRKSKGSILEIGSGTGSLLNHYRKKGWEVIGIEPNKKARSLALAKYNLALDGKLESTTIQDETIDTVIMWHVFEHIQEPKKMLEKISKLMKKDGELIIAAPNCEANENSVYKENWAAYDVPRHLSRYSRKSMEGLLRKKGFVIKQIVPLWLDAIYISALSEKAKGGKLCLAKGIVIGIWSNVKASIQNKEFSSLVYVFTKKDK